ncbi:hypothetical protein ACF065_22875 [Streptomyces sp. NPDC015232]|uniref:hypothetical protein n=1 Tax=unclassified Streptomyces TaxID=2593676 RepID=UPI0036FEB603
MHIAALIAWLLTAVSGFSMLGTWIARGGLRQKGAGASRLPAPVIFGHFALAALGLLVWIAYLAVDRDALAWTAFGLLLPVALLGFTMLARWIPVHRARNTAEAARAGAAGDGGDGPAERHFPLAVVLGHGLLAVATLLLVLLGALGIGAS